MLPAHCYILSKMKKEENEATLRKLLYGNCIKLSLQATYDCEKIFQTLSFKIRVK